MFFSHLCLMELFHGMRYFFFVLQTTVSDVLHAMGAVPSGFRPSTLCRKFNEGRLWLWSLKCYKNERKHSSTMVFFCFFICQASHGDEACGLAQVSSSQQIFKQATVIRSP